MSPPTRLFFCCRYVPRNVPTTEKYVATPSAGESPATPPGIDDDVMGETMDKMLSIAPIEFLEKRAVARDAVRQFFKTQNYLEIETCAMRETTASDVYIASFSTTTYDGQTRFLQTSPEYAHKIFLSKYRRRIFEFARVFRRERAGKVHRSEFSLLEWYRPDADYRDMMAETEALVRDVTKALGTQIWRSGGRKMGSAVAVSSEPFERLTVNDAFLRYVGFAPIGLSREEIIAAARRAGCIIGDDWSWNDVYFSVLCERIEPNLGMDHPTYLCDYPASMASLAMTRGQGDTAVAERFELYICGIELCNGYSELNDPVELRKRFELDNVERAQLGFEQIPIDEPLLSALPSLGKLGGNAMGFERLLMLCLGVDDMRDVRIDV